MAAIDFPLILVAVGTIAFLLWLVALITPRRERYYPVAAVRIFAIAGSSLIWQLRSSQIQSPCLRWSALALIAAAIMALAFWLEGLIRRHVQKGAHHAARR